MQPTASPRATARNRALLVLVTATLWLAFSGKTDWLHLGYGVLSIGLVVLLTRSLVVARRDPSENEAVGRLRWDRGIVYVAWLVAQIVIANVQVTWIIVQPKMPVRPALIRFRTGLTSSLSKTVLGNSITLTPGTFTLQVHEDEFLVHTIHEKLAAGILDGTMQRKVADLFNETVPDDMQIAVMRDPESVRQEVERWSS